MEDRYKRVNSLPPELWVTRSVPLALVAVGRPEYPLACGITPVAASPGVNQPSKEPFLTDTPAKLDLTFT